MKEELTTKMHSEFSVSEETIRRDLDKLEKFMQGKPIAEQEIGKQLLMETASYAESSVCRRKSLLHYFGEEYNEDNCGNCDNCLHPKTRVNASEELRAVIETILTLKEKFKIDYVVNILKGNATAEVKSYRHDEELETFGLYENHDARFLGAVIRQSIIAGYLSKDIENYGVLKVTQAGRDFLASKAKFMIVEDNDFNDYVETETNNVTTGAIDPELFSILKDLRKKVARQHNLPPYVIFQDPSLDAMATTYPINLEELQNIPGVGPGKAKRYGQEFVDLIKKYVDEKEIERPEDMKVRTVANKSKLKLYLISGIDRKVSLESLAESKGLELDELLDELEAIVYSGTKINIDYFINEVMDPDIQEEIYDYFRESESDNIKVAQQKLGDEYTREELRLVRIKFISEMGN